MVATSRSRAVSAQGWPTSPARCCNVNALLQAWEHTSHNSGSSLILPDGCRDLIGLQSPGCAPRWKLSSLLDCACYVEAAVGQRYVGYRLQPGAKVNGATLLREVENIELDDALGAMKHLDAAVVLDARVTDALHALAVERSVRQAARQLGVGERSLQRLISVETGRPPIYWKRLARLRRAARDIKSDCPLADSAADHGYADQAHMNLEFRHWLGLTPTQVLGQTAVQRFLSELGYP